MCQKLLLQQNNLFTFVEKIYTPDLSQPSTIISTLCKLYQQYFCSVVPHFILVNDITGDYPYTSPDYTKIYTTCFSSSWSQIAYQVSHELCHLMIGKPVVSNLRWLEESICEIASWFFIEKLAEQWENLCILGNPNYAFSLHKYVSNILDKIPKNFDLSFIGNSHSSIYDALIANCYDRHMNACIAYSLYPIFQEDNTFWEYVPRIANVPGNLPLLDSLEYWRSCCDTHQATFDLLISRFTS